MKYLIFSDLHIEERNSITYFNGHSRLNDCLTILEKIIQIARDEELDVIMLGDVFEKKDKIPAHVLVPFFECITGFNKPLIKNIWLKGNHDYKSDYSYLDLINYGNFGGKGTFINSPDKILSYEPFIFVPNGEVLNNEVMQQVENPVILFHDEIIGANYNGRTITSQRRDIFQNYKFDLAIGGHIHTPQEFDIPNGKVIYLGSINPVDFGETHQGRFMIYDTESRTYEFRDINHPKFITINNLLINSDIIKNNYIRIKMEIPEEDYLKLDMNVVDEIMKSFQVRGYVNEITSKSPIPNEITITIADQSLISDDELLSEIVKSSETSLDKEDILEYGKDMMDE